MKSCYGSYKTDSRQNCPECSYRKYCQDASDPELLTKNMPSFDDEMQDALCRELSSEQQIRRQRKLNGEKLEYSRNDLLEVIAYMLHLDPLTLALLEEKINDPDITLSEIARRRNTSRQAVQQALRRKCKENPELARLLANRERKTRQRKQLTFMEAVCQIRRQKSPTNSNEPAHGWKFYRSLNSWNLNFDLSKTNIIKGSIILPNV